MDTKSKHPVAALFIVMALSALAPAYHSGAAPTEATAHVIPAAVEPPRSLRALAASHTGVRLAWSAVPGEVTRYEIERKLPDGDFSKVGETTGSECFFTDENLQADPVYIYRVRAVGGGTPSPYSNHAHIRIGDAVAFIPAGVRLDPDGKILRESLKNNVGLWGAIDQEDEFPVFQPGDCLDGDFYVGIQLSHDLGDFNTAALWDASLEITMEYDGDSLWTKPLALDNGDQTFLATVFHDKAISCDPDYRFTVREKTANGSVPAGNVSLKVLLFEKETDGFSATEPIVLAHHYNDIISNVSWSHSREGTASYDLEWVFIAAHENFTGATADSAFKTKEPVRINTRDAFYPHHVFYPEGKVWYRVRAVGMDPDFPSHRINGNWNYGPDAGMAVANSNTGLNWQLQTSFAEGGKYKNMVQYLDGSLRQRQAVTNLNTMGQVLVGETKYDYEGREAVSVLPAPVGSQSLAFRPDLNVFTATDPDIGANTSYQREKFHYDNGSLGNSPLNNASGTGKYYSPANDMSVIHRDYLPDAEGFAYSQTAYTRDGTGRVAAQSGTGKEFRTDGGHPTRFYYGEASSEELIRLFGPNTGKASHYRKNMTVDPNGQTSIAYQDQEGRTVATALAGEPPRGIVDALESYRRNQEAVTQGGLTANPGEPAPKSERNPDEIREEALLAEKERFHREFLEEEKLLLEERYGGEPVLTAAPTSQMGLMSATMPTAKEYKALMDLYRSTNGPAWIQKNGWQDADSLTVQSAAGWTGVTVNANGNITRLHLQNNNLTGTLPSTIVDLVHLNELVIFGNQIGGALPDSIGNMAAMAQLHLNNNRFTGEIPPDIGRLNNLKILFLQNNLLTGNLPASLGDLGSLTHINLYNNDLGGELPPSLGKLSNLEVMSLTFNEFSGSLPDSLGYLSKLTALRLEGNKLKGPLPATLGRLENLRELFLYNNLIDGRIPESLGNLRNIVIIELHTNKLTGPIPESLGHLENLTELHLFNNKLTGSIPTSLGNMKKLKRLLLNFNDLTGELPASLGNLSELNQFTVYENELTGQIPSNFGNLQKLNELVLAYNNFSGTLPPSLNKLKELKTLRLEFNDFEGPLPSGLSQLDKLTLLDIGYNRFTGPLPAGIENLALTHLSVWNNYFTFEHLLPVKDKFSGSGSRFSPQRMTEIPKAYNVREGETLTLSATADRETDPLTEFRWYRGTHPVTPRSTASHTVVLENVSASDAGNYYYDSWNSALPGLTLTGEPQNVHVESPGWKSLTVDLMSHNRKEGNSSVLRKTLLNTVPNTPYSLSYELSGLGTELEGIGCSSCSFELEIMLLDPEGGPVSLGSVSGNTAPDSFSYRNSYTVDDCMVEQTEATVDIGGIVLEHIGDYTVVKELRLLSPTAAQAMAEIRNSPVFAGQLAALDTLYSSYGDCEFCTPEDSCPEAEEAIEKAVEETAAMHCENIREMIISDILKEQDSYTEQDIMAHDLYCQYQNCIRDMEGVIFEATTARLKGWYSAAQWGYYVLEDRDPIYNWSGIGVGHKPALIHALNNISIGGYTGTLDQVTNPDNTAMYYNANGQPDPVNGKHLLYTNLLDQRAEMGETWYQEKLDAQRWMLYRNFYFETSRKIKLGIPAYAGCNGSREALEEMDRLPTTEEEMQEWAVNEGIVEPVDSIQVEAVLYMLVEGCGGTFSLAESNSLYSHLEAYFNGNRMTNPFNLLLEEDMVSNPHLAAVEAILGGKGCSLSESGFAVPNPWTCLRDTVIYTYTEPIQQFSNESGAENNGYRLGDGDTNSLYQQQSEEPDWLAEEEELFKIEEALEEQKIEERQEQLFRDILDALEADSGIGSQAMMNSLQSTPLPPASEYSALMDLYASTNGNTWSDNTGWAAADPQVVQSVQGWRGITVNANGNITRIELNNNQLSGGLLASLGDFPYLERLSLSTNQLTGPLPSELGDLSALTYLGLHTNQLSGQIPPKLGNLSNLVHLYLYSNPLGGIIPPALGNLSSLNYLYLNSTQLTGTIPSQLGNLSNLISLYLNSNQLTGSIPVTLGNLSSLKELRLQGNQLTGPIPPALGNLSSLTYLGLHINQLSGQIPDELGDLSNLVHLYLYSNPFGGSIPPELGNLSKLTHLYLYSNQLVGAIPSELGSLSNLVEMYLSSNQLSDSIPSSLGNLSKLRELRLQGNQLSGSIRPQLANMSALRYLWLYRNQLTGSIPPELGNLSNLTYLNVHSNQLSGSIPVELANLSKMQHLRLYINQLTGEIPEQLGYLPDLRSLFLRNNQLSGDVPLSFSNLTKLSALQLMGNRLSGPLPANFARISDLLLRHNLFTFQDLSLISDNIRNRNSVVYNPQGNVDTLKSHEVLQGQAFALTASVDRDMDPPSEYQWFKNGRAVNQRSVEGHTFVMDTVDVSDEGTYHYRIWNASLPVLSLTSHPQTVNVATGHAIRYCLEYDMGDAEGGYGQPTGNPTMNLYSLPKTWTEIVASCVAENQARAVALKDLAKEKLMESWLEEYYAEFDLSCLDDINEKFSYTYTPKEYHYTLYYYDQSGSLVQTVPPKGVQPMGDAQVAQVKAGTRLHPAHTLATRYRYNSRGQLVRQESPDAGEAKFWYNKAGQLRLSQDARQAAANAYSYTKYDRQGRVTETGEMLSTDIVATLKAKLGSPSFPDSPEYARHDVTLTGYDRPLAGADPAFTQENLRSRVSWTAMAEKDAADTVFTLYSYDPHGNVKALLQDLPGLGSKKTEYRYDLVSGNVNLVLYQYGRSDQLIHRYSYDADNRIDEVYTSTDGYVWNREAKYFYYPHGPLARVELGEYNVQGLDYYYTLQGWLKGVNMPHEGDPGEDGVDGFRTGTDAFAFALGYYEGDYKPVNPNVTLSDTRDKLWDRYRETRDTTSASGLYNGNISWMSTDLPGLGSNRMQAMVYGYDQLHRIVQARSLSEYGSNGYAERAPGANKYDAEYSYDPNGNLISLQRLDENTSLRDSLTYEYNAGTNRLRNTDPADGENYTYDKIGNLVSDAEEGIDSIAWTPYGKVRAVVKDDNSEVRFRYDASGNRIAKIAGSDTTVYVRDASGNVMGVYKNDTLVEQSIYGSSRLGLMTSSSKTGYRTLGGKKYELSNHLGNVLAVVTDNIHLDQDSTWAQVVNMTDYYPFGLAIDGRTMQDSSYRYGFNGKEHDQNGEWGSKSHYDYGFRIYNPSIAKFLSVDPLASSFPWFTPYQFAGNTPIRALDLDGLEILDYRANFRLNFSKTKIHTVYYAEVLNNLNASQSTGINLKSRTLKTEARELYEGQFLIQEAQRPQSVITEGASIWNDRRADFGPADDTADKFMRFNKNPKPARRDAMAWLVSNAAIWTRDNLINGKRNRVQAEINQQIESLQKAFSLAELAIRNTGESVMQDNYKHFDISEEAFKVDLASYIFDGTIPKREEGYDAFIKDQGNRILESSPNVEQDKGRIIE